MGIVVVGFSISISVDSRFTGTRLLAVDASSRTDVDEVDRVTKKQHCRPCGCRLKQSMTSRSDNRRNRGYYRVLGRRFGRRFDR